MSGDRGLGDPGELFRKYGGVVFQRARRLLGNTHDAEEATQEIFVRVIRAVDRFEGRSSPTTWLYQITTNYCLNQIRDRVRHRELLDENMPPPEASSREPAEMVTMRRLLAEAKEAEGRAAIYVLVDGMTYDEAAEQMGVSPRTVWSLVDKFRTWAQQKLAERGVEAVAGAAAKPSSS